MTPLDELKELEAAVMFIPETASYFDEGHEDAATSNEVHFRNNAPTYRRIALELAAQVEQKPQGHTFYVIRRVVGTTTMHYEYYGSKEVRNGSFVIGWYASIFGALRHATREDAEDTLVNTVAGTVIPVTLIEGE